MEPYLLFSNFAIFTGLMSLVWLADKRRRANREQFAQSSQMLCQCVHILQEMRDGNRTATHQLQGAIDQSQAAVMAVAQSVRASAEEQSQALREDLRNSTERAASVFVLVSESLLKSGSELNAKLVAEIRQLADEVRRTGRERHTEMVSEVREVGKRTAELKASLEESIKF